MNPGLKDIEIAPSSFPLGNALDEATASKTFGSVRAMVRKYYSLHDFQGFLVLGIHIFTEKILSS